MFRVAILTASDKGAAGQREDVSGGVIREIMTDAGYVISQALLLPDDRDRLAQAMGRICDENTADLLLTTGGTGFSPRDCTPEATLDVAERQAPGIAEAMRYSSLKHTPRAMLSRGVAAIRKRTLIVNLPGSPKAVRENLEFILPALSHGLEILTEQAHDCGENH